MGACASVQLRPRRSEERYAPPIDSVSNALFDSVSNLTFDSISSVTPFDSGSSDSSFTNVSDISSDSGTDGTLTSVSDIPFDSGSETGEQRINYLFKLNPSLLRHLCKFLLRFDHLATAYTESQKDSKGQEGREDVCQDFKAVADAVVVGECLQLRPGVDLCPYYNVSIACISRGAERLLRQLKPYIKHFTLVVPSFYIEGRTFELLEDVLIRWNPVLESMTIVIEAIITENDLACTEQIHLNYYTLRRLVTLLNDVKVKLTIQADILCGVSLDVKIISEFPVFARPHLTSLRLIDSRSPPVAEGRIDLLAALCSPVNPLATLAMACPVLQHLQLHSHFFSDRFLHALARKVLRTPDFPLLTLEIIKNSCHFTDIPNLSAKAWHALLSTSPCLRVSCDLSGLGPDMLLTLLKPGVPLVSLTVGYSPPDLVANVIKNCQYFSTTLQLFICDIYTQKIASLDMFAELLSDKYSMSEMKCSHLKTHTFVAIF